MSSQEHINKHTGLRNFKLWLTVIALVVLVRSSFFYSHLNQDLTIDENTSVLWVEPGSSLTSLARELETQGVLANAFDLVSYAKVTGKAEQIRAGEYELEQGMSAIDLLKKLVEGQVIYHEVVLVEGWTAMQALRNLQSHEYIQQELNVNNLDELQTVLGLAEYPEGMFFPDTYSFTRGTTDKQVLLQSYDMLKKVLAEVWESRDVGLPYDNAYQALIMASIVEKETAVASERAQIAGVFVRRLQQNIRLQTDPTVIYGMGEGYEGNLTRADLRRDTPYNTYTNRGLPPTPIALVGREALQASVNPDQSNTLYFVAKGDGSHQFSATLEEHNQAVREFQIENRVDDYVSSPQE